MKKLLIILLSFISLVGFSQTNVNPNYTSPYFQASVKVADTLGVGKVVLSDLFKSPGDSANIMFSGQEIRFTAGKFFVTPYFNSLAATPDATLLSFGTGTFSKVGEFGLINNDASNVTSLDVNNFPTKVSSQNMTMNLGVFNSVILGGNGITAKTSNAAYSNRFIWANDGGSFETQINHITPTADRVITLPNETGTIALTSGLFYDADGTVGSNRVATLTNTLSFNGGETRFMKGTTSPIASFDRAAHFENKSSVLTGASILGSTSVGHLGDITTGDATTQIVGGLNAAVWVQIAGGATLSKSEGGMVGYSSAVQLGFGGTVTKAVANEGVFQVLNGAGTITEAIAYRANITTTLGTISNFKGFFVPPLSSVPNIGHDSTRYGVYVEDDGRNYFAGNVGIGAEHIDESAKLQLNSTTQGFLTSRMDTTQRDAITSPATGLLIFNTNSNQFNFYNGSNWKELHHSHIHGAKGFSDSTETLTMSQNVWTPITNASNTLYTTGVTKGDITFTGDSIQVGETATYDINYDLSFSGSNADEYHVAIAVNGVIQNTFGYIIRDMTTSNIGVTTSHTFVDLTEDDWICIMIKNVNNNGDATVYAGNLTIKKI